MRGSRLYLVSVLLYCCWGGRASASSPDVRHKPGPVTMRGTARGVHSHDFSLATHTKGTFKVSVSAATTISARGKSGAQKVGEGDHVGVRGIVRGHDVVAISIRIYPSRAKVRSVIGTIVSVHGSKVAVSTGGRILNVVVTNATTYDVANRPATLRQVRMGERVRVRVQDSTRGSVAVSVHLYVSASAGKKVQIRGVVTAVRAAVVAVRDGASVYQVGISPRTRIYDGSRTATGKQLHVGDAVTIFACCAGHSLVSTSVHVHRSATSKTHVVVKGTVASISPGSVRLTVGSHLYVVAVSSTTRVYVGARSGLLGEVRRGQQATIFACCAGAGLTAASIHVRTTRPVSAHAQLRGTVLAVAGNRLRMSQISGPVDVDLIATTVYDRGLSPTTKGDIHPGERVSIRAVKVGSRLTATHVHLYVSRVPSQRVSGIIVSASHAALVVRANGRTYAIASGAQTRVTLNQVSVPLQSLRPGDRVRISGRPGRTGITAIRIDGRRVAAKAQIVRGTLSDVRGSVLLVNDATGNRRKVTLGQGVRPLLHGQPAPAGALFPGVRIEVRGPMSGSTVIATSVSISVRSRAVNGRVASLSRSSFVLVTTSGRQSRVDVPAGVLPSDGSKHLALTALHSGSFVRAAGYEETTSAVRASTIQVLHPALSLSGTVVSNGRVLVVESRSSERYTIRTSSGTSVSSGRTQILLHLSDIQMGSAVRIQGMVRTDGSLDASQIIVTLVRAQVRGSVSVISAQSLTVGTGSAAVTARFQDGTSFKQGVRAIQASDVVVGDEVSVDGYRIGPNGVLARTVAVHRPLRAVDGTVDSVDADGFTLSTALGATKVVTNSVTVFSGGNSILSVGTHVHVSGYRRGDGVVLATHVRIVAKKFWVLA